MSWRTVIQFADNEPHDKNITQERCSPGTGQKMGVIKLLSLYSKTTIVAPCMGNLRIKIRSKWTSINYTNVISTLSVFILYLFINQCATYLKVKLDQGLVEQQRTYSFRILHVLQMLGILFLRISSFGTTYYFWNYLNHLISNNFNLLWTGVAMSCINDTQMLKGTTDVKGILIM